MTKIKYMFWSNCRQIHFKDFSVDTNSTTTTTTIVAVVVVAAAAAVVVVVVAIHSLTISDVYVLAEN